MEIMLLMHTILMVEDLEYAMVVSSGSVRSIRDGVGNNQHQVGGSHRIPQHEP